MPQAHKGDRVYTPTRLHQELSQLVRGDASRMCQPVGDVIAAIVAEHYGRPDLAPTVMPERPPEELPLAM